MIDPAADLLPEVAEYRVGPGDQLAQRRFERPQVVGHAEAQVQEPAVHGAQFHGHGGAREAGRALGWGFGNSAGFSGGAGAARGAGITGHAVDWHAAFRRRKPDYVKA